MNQAAVERLIPHRPPSLWIDRVESLDPGASCVAWKFIDPANRAFDGHFPAKAVLPGIFLIEATAQTAGVMMGSASSGQGEGVALLAAVNRFKFLKPVLPGAQLRIATRKLTDAGRMAYIEGTLSVEGETVATGELTVVAP